MSKYITAEWPISYFIFKKAKGYDRTLITGFAPGALSKIIEDIIDDPAMSLFDDMTTYSQKAFIRFLKAELSILSYAGTGDARDVELPFSRYYVNPRSNRLSKYVELDVAHMISLSPLLEKLYSISFEGNEDDIDDMVDDFINHGPIYRRVVNGIKWPIGQK